MPTLDELDNLAQKVIVFGPPKVGKTELIGKLAAQFNLIWFDLESGVDTLRKLPTELKKKITVIRVRDTLEYPRAHATIDRVVKGGHFRICDAHGTVDCDTCQKNPEAKWTEIDIPTEYNEETSKTVVVIDSCSQLTISVNAVVTLGKSEQYKETFDDYMAQGKFLNRILSRIQQSPYHCVVTAHELLAEREDGNKKIVPSIGTGNYAVNCSKFFGHVVYLDKVNLKHKAYSDTSYSNNVITGSRLGVAVENMKAPDLAAIFNGEIAPTVPSRAEQAKLATSNLIGLKNLGKKHE
jgi:hypothetical protein